MKHLFCLTVLILLFENVLLKIILTELRTCEQNKEYPIKLKMDLRTVNNIQYLTFDIDLPRPFDKYVMLSVNLYHIAKGKTRKIFTTSDTFCKIFKNYVGKLGEDILKSAKVELGCPIPKGHYSIKNFKLDFRAMGAVTLPLGRFSLTQKYYTQDTNQELTCLYTEFVIN